MQYTATFQHPETGWPVSVRYAFGRFIVRVHDEISAEASPVGDIDSTHYVVEYDRERGSGWKEYAHEVISAHSSLHDAWDACRAAQDAAGSVSRFSVRDRGPASSRDGAGQAVQRDVELSECYEQTIALVQRWNGRRFASGCDADWGVREMSGQQVEGFDQE